MSSSSITMLATGVAIHETHKHISYTKLPHSTGFTYFGSTVTKVRGVFRCLKEQRIKVKLSVSPNNRKTD